MGRERFLPDPEESSRDPVTGFFSEMDSIQESRKNLTIKYLPVRTVDYLRELIFAEKAENGIERAKLTNMPIFFDLDNTLRAIDIEKAPYDEVMSGAYVRAGFDHAYAVATTRFKMIPAILTNRKLSDFDGYPLAYHMRSVIVREDMGTFISNNPLSSLLSETKLDISAHKMREILAALDIGKSVSRLDKVRLLSQVGKRMQREKDEVKALFLAHVMSKYDFNFLLIDDVHFPFGVGERLGIAIDTPGVSTYSLLEPIVIRVIKAPEPSGRPID